MTVLELTHTSLALYPILASSAPADPGAPLPAVILIAGLLLLVGFAAGITFEQLNMRVRERQLAQGRRRLAAQARGLRRQHAEFYRRPGNMNGKAPKIGDIGLDEMDKTGGINSEATAGTER
jgi:hypothetical protein